MLQIYIDNEWKSFNSLIPYTFNKKKDEMLDNAVVTRLTRDKNILPPLTCVKIIDETETHWIVANCTSDRYGVGTYKQTLYLVEPTEILKGYPMENINIRQPIDPNVSKKTLLYEVTRLLDIAITHKLEDAEAKSLLSRIELSNETRIQLDEIISPEFFFTEMTLFDIFIEIGLFLDSVPKLKFKGNTNKFELYFEKLDLDNKKKYYIDKPIFESQEQPLGNYAEQVVSHVQNILMDNTITYPSKNLGVYADAKENTVTDSNACITLPDRIQRIVKFEIENEVFGPDDEEFIDYTHFIYEHGEYTLLEPTKMNATDGIPWNRRQPYVAYYKYNTDTISFGSEFPYPYHSSSTRRQIMYRITYIPVVDTILKDQNKDDPQYSVLYNQSENVVSGTAVSEKLRNYIKRMKHGNNMLSSLYKNFDDIPEPGHIVNDEYIVTNVSYTRYRSHFDVTLELSKEYTRRSEFIRAKQEIRNWEIPADGKVVERNVVYKERVNFIFGSEDIEGRLKPNSVVKWRKILPFIFFKDKDYEGTFTAINFKARRSTYYIMMTTSITSIGNTLLYGFKAINNTLIGYSKSLKGLIDKVANLWGVTYTDEYGEFETADIGFVTDVEYLIDKKTFAQNYPISSPEQNTNLFNHSYIQLNDLKFKKSAGETISFTYQLALESDDLVVHDNLVKTANFNNEPDNWQPYVYLLNKKVSKNQIISDTDILQKIPVNLIEDFPLNNNRFIYRLGDVISVHANNCIALALGSKFERDGVYEDKLMIIDNNPSWLIREQLKNKSLILNIG